MSTRALASHGGHEGGKFFGWRPPLQCEREAFVVVVSFPSSEANGGRREIIESPAPPELRLVDSVTAFDLPVLLGPPGPDVAMSNPQRLEGKGESERKLVAVVALQLPDPKGKRSAELAEECEA
jgi:hypothetical protein